jgi:hypothetical protein
MWSQIANTSPWRSVQSWFRYIVWTRRWLTDLKQGTEHFCFTLERKSIIKKIWLLEMYVMNINCCSANTSSPKSGTDAGDNVSGFSVRLTFNKQWCMWPKLRKLSWNVYLLNTRILIMFHFRQEKYKISVVEMCIKIINRQAHIVSYKLVQQDINFTCPICFGLSVIVTTTALVQLMALKNAFYKITGLIVCCVREVPCSNLGPKTGHPQWGFSWISQFLQANAGIVP